ncbi:50S ribosomal protein L11 methyltransferase [Lachnoclostridium sp.]|uniref:50S ribosomal protein L11 methyltransferase n=1 Tax=Lachnoclostridium sp. TaxID=2028282 RepID=UPI0028A12583|nr:50S ribosomal protein L11 methyltransferase [Lachnoclostridium sp.]
MKWKKLSLETTTEAVDLVCDMLLSLGIEGIEVVDKVPITEEEKKRMFIDILPELGEDDGIATINFYLENEEDLPSLNVSIQEGLEELRDFVEVGSGKLSLSETEDKDWINNWKEFFKPFRVDDTIVIKPTWEKLEERKETDLVIEIDPGTAFGTGAHETTKLCILNIKKYMQPGATLLDVGCGSGILTIIGRKLGAKTAVAIDIDENAVTASKENCDVNQLEAVLCQSSNTATRTEGRIELFDGNVIDDRELRERIGLNSYDFVVANILADIIIPLSAVVGEFMKPGAYFISSGIIDMKAEEVKEAIIKNGFIIEEITTMGDWTSIVAKKPE